METPLSIYSLSSNALVVSTSSPSLSFHVFYFYVFFALFILFAFRRLLLSSSPLPLLFSSSFSMHLHNPSCFFPLPGSRAWTVRHRGTCLSRFVDSRDSPNSYPAPGQRMTEPRRFNKMAIYNVEFIYRYFRYYLQHTTPRSGWVRKTWLGEKDCHGYHWICEKIRKVVSNMWRHKLQVEEK